MFVFDHLMGLSGFNRDHKGAQVLVCSPWSKSTVRVVLSAFYKSLLPLSVNLNLFLLGQKVAGINLESLRQLQQKGNRRRQAV